MTDGYEEDETQILGYVQVMYEYKEESKISRNGPVYLNEVEPIF